MVETWDEAWRRVRRRRSVAWGRTDGDPTRRAVYSAALEQAEQFATAAHSVGPATKPVLLFYALSQAGRAIAADLAQTEWEIAGHGATVRLEPSAQHVFDASFQAVRAAKSKPEAGAFVVVANATGSPVPRGRVTVADLWKSLPELAPASWRLGSGLESRVLRFSEEGATSGVVSALTYLTATMTQANFGYSRPELERRLSAYPMAEGFEIREFGEGWQSKTVVVWPDGPCPAKWCESGRVTLSA